MVNTLNTEPAELSVGELATAARQLLESHFDIIWVVGEISNFTCASSGHWYFTLKDNRAQVRCALFKSRNQFLRYRPKQGDQVRLKAKVSLYEGRGEFQLVGDYIEPAGTGDLQLAFLTLKARLESEGLFETSHKQPLPVARRRIGVITSTKGAALHDILTVLARRWPALEVIVAGSPVQGQEAPEQLLRALQRLEAYHQNTPLDLVVLSRGGGSLEDLWAFNDESLARAIAAYPIPTLSAVGHETDFTICDWVADARAPTPSAGAEMISPDQATLVESLLKTRMQLQRACERVIEQHRAHCRHLSARLRHPGELLEQRAQRLDELELRLVTAQQRLVQDKRSTLLQLNRQVQWYSPSKSLAASSGALDQLSQRLERAQRRLLSDAESRLSRAAQMLHTLSPLNTVERGYAILRDEGGAVLTSAQALAPRQRGRATLKDGEFDFVVAD